jgi:hypothetical protein
MQDSSKLVGYVIRIRVWLGHGSCGRHHVNQLCPKGKLRRGLIAKATAFRLVIGIELRRVLVGVVG